MITLSQQDRYYANKVVSALRVGLWDEVSRYYTGEAPMFATGIFKRRPLYLAIPIEAAELPDGETVEATTLTLHEEQYRRRLLWLHGDNSRLVCHQCHRNPFEIDCDNCRLGFIMGSRAKPYRQLNKTLQLQVQAGYEVADHLVLAGLVNPTR